MSRIGYKSLQELAAILKTDPTAFIITTDEFRRGDILQEWAKLLHVRLRTGRWFGGYHSRALGRILIYGRSQMIGAGIPVYYDDKLLEIELQQ